MKIKKMFEKYEIFDSETNEIYFTGYFDLLAYRNLRIIKKEHCFARLRKIYKEV